jgi:hypothetical protein
MYSIFFFFIIIIIFTFYSRLFFTLPHPTSRFVILTRASAKVQSSKPPILRTGLITRCPLHHLVPQFSQLAVHRVCQDPPHC